MGEHDRYVGGSAYVKIGPEARAVASEVKGSEDRVDALIDYLGKHLSHRKEDKSAIFRERDSEEILESGYVTGCTDMALAFLAVNRAMRVPARYVETLEARYLENPDNRSVMGHIYVELFEDGGWNAYDPSIGRVVFRGGVHRKIHREESSGRIRRYVRVASGLDHADLYREDTGEVNPLFDVEDMRRLAISRQEHSQDSLAEKFDRIREGRR